MHNFTPSVFAVLTSSSSGPQIRAGNHTYTLNDKKKDTKRKIQKESYYSMGLLHGRIAGHGTDNLPVGRGYCSHYFK
jgi:hypothetical protein